MLKAVEQQMQWKFIYAVRRLARKECNPALQTNEDRTLLNFQELQERGVDVRGIRYLVPVDQSCKSMSPCLMIREKRLSTLFVLEEAFRKLQKSDSGPQLTQIGLMVGLDILTKASLNPQAEYERATLAAQATVDHRS